MRDKYLTEAMGECWHKAVDDFESISPRGYFTGRCSCDISSDDHHGKGRLPLDEYTFDYPAARTDFSTWGNFGKLWEWVIEQVWWDVFFLDHSVSAYTPHKVWRRSQVKELTNPDRFADAVYEFLKGREE